MALRGGVGEVKEATPQVQEIVQSVKSAAEEKAGRSFSEFSAKSFRTQVVAGRNYFVKVHVGDGKFVHIRVFKSLHSGISLHGIQDEKLEMDELSYF